MPKSVAFLKKRDLLTLLQTYRQRQQTAISRYRPFAKQRRFHEAGQGMRER